MLIKVSPLSLQASDRSTPDPPAPVMMSTFSPAGIGIRGSARAYSSMSLSPGARTTMKAQVYHGHGKRAWEDKPRPTIQDAGDAIVRITSREQLFPVICNIAVEHGGLRLASIILIDQADRHPNLVAWYGEAAASRNELHAAGRDLTGEALRSGTPVISNDILNDPTTTPWHEAARRAGMMLVGVSPLDGRGLHAALLVSTLLAP